MELLDKFNQVEIKPESRIDAADKRWCDTYHTAYDKAVAALIAMQGYAAAFTQEQHDIFAQTLAGDDLKYQDNHYIKDGFDAAKYQDRIESIHKSFINDLVSHVAGKYQVTLDGTEIVEQLVPAKPEEPSIDFYLYGSPRQWSDDVREKVHTQRAAYEAEMENYHNSLRELRVSVSDVLDRIFMQLGGVSFEDKAIREIKDACHKASWYDYNGKPRFDQKKSVVAFTGHGCSIDYIHEKHKSPSDPSEFKLSDEMKTVLKAVSHFETGLTDYTPPAITHLLGWHINDVDHELGGKKIRSVKLFKNGRVDMRFTSEAYAREFVEQYMGTAA